MFSRSEIRLLKQLSRPMSLEEVAKAIGLSVSRASELVSGLKAKNFLKKTGRTVEWSDYSYANKLRRLLHSNPRIDFEDFLYGKRMDVLLYLGVGGGKHPALQGMNLDLIAGSARTTKEYARNILYELRKKGIVYKERGAWFLNKGLWPDLTDFLAQYRLIREKEVVFTPTENRDMGEPTGFSAYPRYGVIVYPKAFMYYSGPQKMGPELVFAHSLYQVSDERTRGLAREFLEKNRLDKKKVLVLVNFYGLQEKYREVAG